MWFGKDLNHGKSAACLCTQNGAVVRAHRVYRVWLCLKYRSATPIENLLNIHYRERFEIWLEIFGIWGKMGIWDLANWFRYFSGKIWVWNLISDLLITGFVIRTLTLDIAYQWTKCGPWPVSKWLAKQLSKKNSASFRLTAQPLGGKFLLN